MNKTNLSLIEAKFFALIDITYQLVKSSILFWILLIKNFIFLGLTISFCTLVEVVDEIFSGNGKPIRILFREISPKYKGYKKLSMITFCLIIYLSAFILIPFPGSISSYLSSIIKFACIYLFLLTIVLFTYISGNVVKLDVTLKQSTMVGFYLMVKRFFRTIMLIIILLVIFYVAHKNIIFFFFFAPAIYAMGARFVLKKII